MQKNLQLFRKIILIFFLVDLRTKGSRYIKTTTTTNDKRANEGEKNDQPRQIWKIYRSQIQLCVILLLVHCTTVQIITVQLFSVSFRYFVIWGLFRFYRFAYSFGHVAHDVVAAVVSVTVFLKFQVSKRTPFQLSIIRHHNGITNNGTSNIKKWKCRDSRMRINPSWFHHLNDKSVEMLKMREKSVFVDSFLLTKITIT